jgi:ribonuclease HI
MPPPPGVININVDAALFPTEHQMGWAVVLRDHDGNFVLVFTRACFLAPELAEALASRCALSVAKDHVVSKVALVSDYMLLIQQKKPQVQDRSTMGTIIRDIKSLH